MVDGVAFRADVARRIFVVLGVTALAACGDDTTGTGGSGGGTGGEAQGGQAQGGQAQGGQAQGGQAQGGQAQGGQAQGGQAEGGAAQGGSGEGGAGGGGGGEGVERCFFQVNPGACPSLAEAPQYYPCTDSLEVVSEWVSGPEIVGQTCCYDVVVGPPNDPNCAVIGRPFMVDDAPQRAPLANSSVAATWARGPASPSLQGLSVEARAELARAWSEDAAYEHASVASFAKLSLELLAFGAPEALVSAAHEAAIDEVRHASLGFTLASAYAGEPIGPGPLAAAARVELATDLVSLAVSAVREGCVGETLAALVAGAQRDVATDPAVRAALMLIAEDETRHAELAWRTVKWALEVGGVKAREAVSAAFDQAVAAVLAATGGNEPAHHAHGRLSSAEAQAERVRGVRDVVTPAARALLGG